MTIAVYKARVNCEGTGIPAFGQMTLRGRRGDVPRAQTGSRNRAKAGPDYRQPVGKARKQDLARTLRRFY